MVSPVLHVVFPVALLGRKEERTRDDKEVGVGT
jgi:hypothetical protein